MPSYDANVHSGADESIVLIAAAHRIRRSKRLSLASDWAAVVGDRLAAESAPVSLDGGVLVVAASDGPWGAQVRFLASEIAKKANAELGSHVVRQVRVVVRPDQPKHL